MRTISRPLRARAPRSRTTLQTKRHRAKSRGSKGRAAPPTTSPPSARPKSPAKCQLSAKSQLPFPNLFPPPSLLSPLPPSPSLSLSSFPTSLLSPLLPPFLLFPQPSSLPALTARCPGVTWPLTAHTHTHTGRARTAEGRWRCCPRRWSHWPVRPDTTRAHTHTPSGFAAHSVPCMRCKFRARDPERERVSALRAEITEHMSG